MRSLGYTDGNAEPRSGWATVRALLPYLWPQGQPEMRARVVLALIMLAASKVALVYVPILFGQSVDALTGADASTLVVIPVGIILAYGLARVLAHTFGQLRDAVFAKVGQRAIRTIALEVFEHLHRLSLRFHLARETGGVSRSIERGSRAIDLLLRFTLFNVAPTIMEFVMVFAVLWGLLNFWIAFVTMLTVVFYIWFTAAVTEWRTKIRRVMNEEDNRANTKAIDSLLNFETVKYFGNESFEARRYDKTLASYEDAAVKSHTTLAFLNAGQAVVISVGLTLVMYMAAQGIKDGEMTVGDFVMANTYLMQLYQPLNFFGFVYREIKQALVDIEKMFELLNENTEIADETDASNLSLSGAAIRFEGVSFAYDERRPILRDVSFEIPAGNTLAIVGPSGSGKSTLGRLLFRFYDVGAGTISVDGQDIRQITQRSLRESIGIVPQDTVLFNDTVYYNIAYGAPGAPPADVEEAARLARIHDYIMAFPDGYQSMVGERGLKLSGGEKQRVAIARAILKQPDILVFDEATSALDTGTEREIQRNLDELARGRTTMVIAHRLSTVVHADEIIVLADGYIAERGRHDELLQRGGRYAEMWHRQLEEKDSGSAAGLNPSAASPA